MIDLLLKFPSQEDVVADEVARFRALSPAERVHSLAESFELYHFLVDQSRLGDRLEQFAAEEDARVAESIRAFVTRHAR